MTIEGHLLDTSVASWLWDAQNPNHALAQQNMAALPRDLVFVSAITLAEIEYGLAVSPAIDRARHDAVRAAMAQYQVLNLDHHTALEYSRIRAALFMKHSSRDIRGRLTTKRVEDLIEPTSGRELGIQENDLWIVSVAVQYDLRFVTGDQAGGMRRVLEAANYVYRTDFWGNS